MTERLVEIPKKKGDVRKILMEVGWPQDPRFHERSSDAKLVYWAVWDRGRHEMRDLLPSYYNARSIAAFLGADMTEERCAVGLEDLASNNPIPLIAIEDGRIRVYGLKQIHSWLRAWKDEDEANRSESITKDRDRSGSMVYRTEQNRTEQRTPTSSKAGKPTLSMCTEFLKFYRTEISDSTGLPLPRELTESRKRHLRSRLKEPSFARENWSILAKKIRDSPFLRGEAGKESWKGATFDWLIKSPNNAVKVLEGNYDSAGDGLKPYE